MTTEIEKPTSAALLAAIGGTSTLLTKVASTTRPLNSALSVVETVFERVDGTYWRLTYRTNGLGSIADPVEAGYQLEAMRVWPMTAYVTFDPAATA